MSASFFSGRSGFVGGRAAAAWIVLAGLSPACGGAPAVEDASVPMDLVAPATGDLGVAVALDSSWPEDLAGDFAVDPYGPYPPGPYGAEVGDVIPPLEWEGYVVPHADVIADTTPYRRYTMDDLRRSGARYGFVHVAEFT